MSWLESEDGMVEFRIRLPKEEAALVLAAVNAAKDEYGSPPTVQDHETGDRVDATPRYGSADAVLDVARAFLDTAPEDRSGEDRTLVVVHVAADQLAAGAAPGQIGAAPGQTGAAASPVDGEASASGADLASGVTRTAVGDVPAGTSDPTCHVQGVGGIEPATAARLARDAELLTTAVDATGEVLALGRSRRVVSRGQRRALMIRDGMCQFPGCHQERHLDAHHIVAWSRGGRTDFDNLVLLCRFHHTTMHEGGMSIVRSATPTATQRWEFLMPDGSQPRPWWHADTLARLLADHTQSGGQAATEWEEFETIIKGVDRFDHPDARRILPGWAGGPFDIHECVQALYRMHVSRDPKADELEDASKAA